ncbi:hypothetical protein Tco_0922655 [Tanacetum coccineum]|uniref:Uncharacterized protein n=1 Tax=Tanacetum coccineum TaxID=301880 RepID=A0ABQ5D220_9ASTR
MVWRCLPRSLGTGFGGRTRWLVGGQWLDDFGKGIFGLWSACGDLGNWGLWSLYGPAMQLSCVSYGVPPITTVKSFCHFASEVALAMAAGVMCVRKTHGLSSTETQKEEKCVSTQTLCGWAVGLYRPIGLRVSIGTSQYSFFLFREVRFLGGLLSNLLPSFFGDCEMGLQLFGMEAQRLLELQLLGILPLSIHNCMHPLRIPAGDCASTATVVFAELLGFLRPLDGSCDGVCSIGFDFLWVLRWTSRRFTGLDVLPLRWQRAVGRLNYHSLRTSFLFQPPLPLSYSIPSLRLCLRGGLVDVIGVSSSSMAPRFEHKVCGVVGELGLMGESVVVPARWGS